MKLSALLAPLLDAKVSHELIRAQILAYEAEQTDALEQRRKADAERQSRKRSRDITLRHSDRLLARDRVASAEDKSLTKEIEPQEKKVSKQRGTRLPNDFQPDLDFAIQVGLTPSQAQAEVAKFRDYWAAKAGSNGTKMDWQATWRNWAREAFSRLARAGPRRKEDMVSAAQDLLNEFKNADIRSQPSNPSLSPPLRNVPLTLVSK